MNILVIAYHLGGVTAEGLITAKLLRALAACGHRVEVIAGAAEDVAPPPPGVRVHRIGPRERAGAAWRQRIERRARTSRAWDRLAAAINVIDGVSGTERAWVKAAAARAGALIKAGPRFDVLHSRLNPVSSHLAALATLRKHPRDLPWCAYFSDPWPHHRYPPPYRFTSGRIARARGEGQLTTLVRRADSLVLPDARLRDHLLAGRLRPARAKTLIAPHLGTACWPPAVGEAQRGRILRLRHCGFLMRERRIEPLAEALERLVARRPEARDCLRIEFAGRYPTGQPPAVPSGLETMIRFRPYLPPPAARGWLAGADVFLLVEADMKEGIFFPSKLADYLSGERPILALSPRCGVAADRLAHGGGLLAPPADSAAIEAALESLLRGWREGWLADLRPSAEQRRSVSAQVVVACYEAAFRHAGAQEPA